MADWCKTHPTYSAKRPPKSLCGKCFELYFLKNPEDSRNTLGFRTSLQVAKAMIEGDSATRR